jgi:predicted enzyme related to lactoylglutathione lyase
VERRSEDGLSAVVVICREGRPVEKLTIAARPYWVIRKKADFFDTHNRLKEQGFDVTDIAGNPKFLVLFHTYDPYGNQINVWSYENC